VTALCGGGASGPKPTSPAVAFLLGEAAVAIAVETLGLSAPWAALLAFAAGQTITTSTLCATDPPVMPSFTAGDIADILRGAVIANPSAFAKLTQLFQIAAWYVFCQCSSMPTPAPVAGPPYPTGAPVVNPPAGPGMPASPCWDVKGSFFLPTPTDPNDQLDLTSQFLPIAGTPIRVNPQTGFFPNAYPIPGGTNHLRLAVTPQQASEHAYVRWLVWDKFANSIRDDSLQVAYNDALGSPVTLEVATLSPAAAYWSLTIGNGWPNQRVDERYALEILFYCGGGGPSAPAAPCCPPDPVLLGQLSQIINLLNAVLLGQGAPITSYAESTVHAGLSGRGSIAVQGGCLAVRVVLTTDNPALRTLPGNPTYLLDRGFIVPIAAEGPVRGQTRLVYNPQLYVLPATTDHVGYSFGTGVVGSIIELVRGP
jgi:hypothetical protein